MKTSTSKIFFSIIGIILSLVFAGCSKDDPDLKAERKISKHIGSNMVRTLVEDVASGQVISDDTQTTVYSEDTYIWDGDFLKNIKYVNYGKLYSSYVYSYNEGRLAEIKDEADGQLFHFSYSDGHLDKIVITTDTDAMEITQYFYDEQGRAKSVRKFRTDGSDLPERPGSAYITHELEYSGNNISRETVKYYDSIESDEPGATIIYNITYNSAINPFKGIYRLGSGLIFFGYFSANVCNGVETISGGEKTSGIPPEITLDGEYPVRMVTSENYSFIKDGKRTTVEYTDITEYEYLD